MNCIRCHVPVHGGGNVHRRDGCNLSPKTKEEIASLAERAARIPAPLVSRVATPVPPLPMVKIVVPKYTQPARLHSWW